MVKRIYPILEFDEDRDVIIRPSLFLQPIDISKKCVISFFRDAIEQFLKKYPYKIVTTLKSESMDYPVYEVDYGGEKIALVQAGVGAPIAAGQIEELSALGCQIYIACGGCGVLNCDIPSGHLILPTSAVRDEGVSYHYMRPTREIAINPGVIAVIAETLDANGIYYHKTKTWTTDAFYRETHGKLNQRLEEGCEVVEMETSAFAAVAIYNHALFGQILYAGDRLYGPAWDSNKWRSKTNIRALILTMAFEAILKLETGF